jgi:hypothetical protein
VKESEAEQNPKTMQFSKDFQMSDSQPETTETGANNDHAGRSSDIAIRSQFDVRDVDVFCSYDSPN